VVGAFGTPVASAVVPGNLIRRLRPLSMKSACVGCVIAMLLAMLLPQASMCYVLVCTTLVRGHMRRRDFITLLGGAAGMPFAAHGQQATPVIGYLGSSSLVASAEQLAGFRRGLSEASFVEGRNVAIEYRWSEGLYDRLQGMAADLASRQVAVILASGLPAALAAKAATTTIPILFVMGADPVTSGLVPSFNRPGGNITGVSQFYGALGGKRLELLREIVPSAKLVAVLTDPNNPNSENHLTDVRAVARAVGQRITIAAARNEAEIDAAFAGFARERADALLVADDPFFTVQRKQIVALAARQRLAAIYYAREYVIDGGLITYGSASSDNYRLAGGYVGRILNGAKPADLPVLQPTKFELVINLKVAKALGLTMPPTVIARADEVIE
jgi:putative ABC transport system substrate-binding protein